MESNIRIMCPARVRDTIRFAENNRCVDQFAKGWLNLMSVITGFDPGDNPANLILISEVWADWAEHSFAWGVKRQHREENPLQGKYLLVGGLIYHGPRDTGGGGPDNFSVSLSRSMAGEDRIPHEWTVHT